MAAIYSGTVTLHPAPGFVVKSKIVDGSGIHVYLTKVFINICHDSNVPKPKVDFDPAVVFPLIVENQWEIPIVVSPEKSEKDKKGVPAFVYDCCMNPECFSWIQVNSDLKLIAVEWCIEAIELMHGIVLEREYTEPKMLSKGKLSETEITKEDMELGLHKRMQELQNNETLGLIEELSVEEDTTDLPDLMDIGGKRLKPLIEEIGEMSIGEQKRGKAPEKITEKFSKDKITELESIQLTETDSAAQVGSLKLPQVSYTYTVTCARPRDLQFVIKFESRELTPLIEVTQQPSCVTIRNCDATRRLGKTNRVEIPIPRGACAYRSFLVLSEHAVYIFCQNSVP